MDKVISEPSSSKIQVLAHNQYRTVEHLTPSSVDPSPLTQFHHWFKAAASSSVVEPEAMALSTICPQTGTPSSRIVLFRQLDDKGFIFYTNYSSRKSKELEGSGKASLCFYWREIHKQVRVVGRVEKVDRQTSEDYFRTRPLGSQLGAWASRQSEVIGEDELQQKLDEATKKFGVAADDTIGDVPLPDFWGGWRVVPHEVEFWCGKPSRLHDRVRYLRPSESDPWKIERLSP